MASYVERFAGWKLVEKQIREQINEAAFLSLTKKRSVQVSGYKDETGLQAVQPARGGEAFSQVLNANICRQLRMHQATVGEQLTIVY